ncbi:MAG: RNA polymerase sigma factor [Planctomycetota bacterium]
MNDPDFIDLEQCRRGDPRVLASLHRVFGDRVFRICLGVLGQHADAEDAAQEVLLRILEGAGSFAGRSRFSTWVFRLTVNHCLNRRKQRRLGLTKLPEEDSDEPISSARSPLQEAAAAEERVELHAALARLRPRHRVALVLRELEGLSYREMAEVLQVPVGTVMSRLARARQELLRRLPGLLAERTETVGDRHAL